MLKCVFVNVALLGLPLLIGCGSNATGNSDEVDQTNIFGDYSLRVDAESHRVDVTAAFRYAGSTGTTLRLTGNSRVEVNGTSLSLVDGDRQVLNLLGTYYHRRLGLEQAPEAIEFAWTRNDGTTYRNTITVAAPLVPVALLADGQTTIRPAATDTRVSVSRAQGAIQVTFDGQYLGVDETLSCSMVSEARVEPTPAESTPSAEVVNTSLFGVWNSSVKQCLFKKEEVARFQLGAAKLVLERRWHQSGGTLGHERAGSWRTSTYVSQPLRFTVVE